MRFLNSLTIGRACLLRIVEDDLGNSVSYNTHVVNVERNVFIHFKE